MPALVCWLAVMILVLACGETRRGNPRQGQAGSESWAAGDGGVGGTSSEPPFSQGGQNGSTSGAPDGAGAPPSSDPRVPSSARTACLLYSTFLDGYQVELGAAAGGAASAGPTPPTGQADVGPCNSCIGSCEREQPPGCAANEACVMRHCAVGTANVCECAAGCAAPKDGPCLAAWVQYAVCLSEACASVCPSPN